MSGITVRPAPVESQLRCAVCHDALAVEVAPCAGCGTRVHVDCAREVRGCPTLGCPQRVAAWSARAARRGRRLVLGLMALAVAAIAVPLGQMCGAILDARVDLVARESAQPRQNAPVPLARAERPRGDVWPCVVLQGALFHGGSGLRRIDVTWLPARGEQEPARCTVRISDREDRELSQAEAFGTGFLCAATPPSVVADLYSERDLLLITTEPAAGGYRSRQYYGITSDDRLALLRFEVWNGREWELNGTGDYGGSARVGPAAPVRTADEWAGAIRSPDPYDALEALTWLMGARSSLPVKLRIGGALIEAVQQRLDDPNPWIRQAARESNTRLVLGW